MILFSQLLFGWLVILLLIQAALVARFWFVLTGHQRASDNDDDCLSAAVILCVRGNDPTLASCLQSLLQLDYPDLMIRIVADSVDDPACETVQRLIADSSSKEIDVRLMITNKVRSTCSLKCNSLIEAVNAVKDDVEIIALIDADTQAHPTWLRELAAALQDPTVGAATGIRWYVPVAASFGSMIRYIWNAAAIVQMQAYRIAWGGTLAFKSSVFENGEILGRWEKAFCEDTMTRSVLRQQNMKVALVPSLVMSSSEAASVTGVIRWICRQLLTSRLYHPAWLLVVSHCFSTTIAPLLCLIMLIVTAISGNLLALVWFAAGIVMYEICAIGMLIAIEHATRTAAGDKSESMRWLHPGRLPGFLTGLFVTQLAYAWAMTGAIFKRRFEWRGIEYQLRRSKEIAMSEYAVYQSEDNSDSRNKLSL